MLYAIKYFIIYIYLLYTGMAWLLSLSLEYRAIYGIRPPLECVFLAISRRRPPALLPGHLTSTVSHSSSNPHDTQDTQTYET